MVCESRPMPEIAAMIRSEADTCGCTPFFFLAWLNEYFIRIPAPMREEQRKLDDLLTGKSRESRYVN